MADNLCGADVLPVFTHPVPPAFTDLLMFVISSITLEDNDWEKKKLERDWRNLYGTNIDNSWLLGIGEEEKMQTMLMNGN